MSSIKSCFSFFRFLMILLLPLAVFGLVVASYLHYLSYKMPIHSVITIGIIFFIFLLFIPHNAYYSSCKIINRFKDLKAKIKKKIRATLLKIQDERKSTLNMDQFLHEYFSDLRNDNFASVATTIFPMLGILGTFVAIAISMPDFSVTSTDALDREISALLDGVGTAFYASIYGIFLSIWWIFFEKRGMSKIDRYQSLVKSDFSKYLWDEATLNHYKIVQRQLENEELIAAFKDSFNLHFMKRFNDAYIESYKELLENTKTSFKEVNENMLKASSTVSTLMENTVSSKENIQLAVDMDKKVDRFQEAVGSLDKTLDKTFEKIDSEVGDIVKKLADFADIVARKSDDVELSLRDYHRQVRKLIKD